MLGKHAVPLEKIDLVANFPGAYHAILGLFWKQGEQNPGMKNLPLKTRIVTRMVSSWITHLGKSQDAGGIGVSKLGLNICP